LAQHALRCNEKRILNHRSRPTGTWQVRGRESARRIVARSGLAADAAARRLEIGGRRRKWSWSRKVCDSPEWSWPSWEQPRRIETVRGSKVGLTRYKLKPAGCNERRSACVVLVAALRQQLAGRPINRGAPRLSWDHPRQPHRHRGLRGARFSSARYFSFCFYTG
jgi:hypothetical protein